MFGILQNKKSIYIISAVALILVVIVAGAIIYSYLRSSPVAPGIGSNSIPASPTKAEIPSDAIVPETPTSTVPAGVAAPTAVNVAAPGVEAKDRSFEISAENNKFTPSTVIVRTGDSVRITLNAIDGAYDITIPDYGLKQTAQKGESKILVFQAMAAGDFTFYCESCGGLNSTATGHLIVTAQ